MEKKQKSGLGRRLRLNKKAIRRLTDEQLEGVVGGMQLIDDTCSDGCCPAPSRPKKFSEPTYNSIAACR